MDESLLAPGFWLLTPSHGCNYGATGRVSVGGPPVMIEGKPSPAGMFSDIFALKIEE
jgi:hypothetical protein